MSDINVVCVAGRLTKDSELRFTSNGTPVAKFSLAVNRWAKDKEEANFFDITLWGKQAESLNPYLTKGRQVVIQGELEQQRWEKDGQKFSRVGVTARHVQLVGREEKKDDPIRERPTAGPEDFDDDIPF